MMAAKNILYYIHAYTYTLICVCQTGHKRQETTGRRQVRGRDYLAILDAMSYLHPSSPTSFTVRVTVLYI